jgi:hypothetical protein
MLLVKGRSSSPCQHNFRDFIIHDPSYICLDFSSILFTSKALDHIKAQFNICYSRLAHKLVLVNWRTVCGLVREHLGYVRPDRVFGGNSLE